MPAYSTTYKALKGLSSHAAAVTLAHARDLTKSGFLQIDNVQYYKNQRDIRMGRVNQMIIGIAATYAEMDGIDISAFDLDDKRRHLAQNERLKVTVETYQKMLDQQHLEIISALHWLRVLTLYVPQLSELKDHISMLFRTRGAKIPLRPQAHTCYQWEERDGHH